MLVKSQEIADLRPAEYNPRRLSEKEYSDIKASLSRFGMVEPIVINSNIDRKNIVIGGHQRLKIWRELGNDQIPTVAVDLDKDREKELNIRLNKNTGSFDYDILANYFDETNLIDWGFDDIPISDEKLLEKDDDDFIDEANKITDENCKYPIVPEFLENHQYFIIITENDIDGNYIRSKFGLDKTFKSPTDSNERKSNVLTIENIRGAFGGV